MVALIRALMMSVPDMVVFPMQDVLGLGSEARMNYTVGRERELAMADDAWVGGAASSFAGNGGVVRACDLSHFEKYSFLLP